MSSIFNANKSAKGHITSANFCIVNDLNGNTGNINPTQGGMQVALQNTGYANNFRG